MVVNQYYYDARHTTLSAAVLSQIAAYDVDDKLLKVYVRKDEVTDDDDFEGLNVTMLTKSLQPRHFQIGASRKPKIEVKRIPCTIK